VRLSIIQRARQMRHGTLCPESEQIDALPVANARSVHGAYHNLIHLRHRSPAIPLRHHGLLLDNCGASVIWRYRLQEKFYKHSPSKTHCLRHHMPVGEDRPTSHYHDSSSVRSAKSWLEALPNSGVKSSASSRVNVWKGFITESRLSFAPISALYMSI